MCGLLLFLVVAGVIAYALRGKWLPRLQSWWGKPPWD